MPLLFLLLYFVGLLRHVRLSTVLPFSSICGNFGSGGKTRTRQLQGFHAAPLQNNGCIFFAFSPASPSVQNGPADPTPQISRFKQASKRLENCYSLSQREEQHRHGGKRKTGKKTSDTERVPFGSPSCSSNDDLPLVAVPGTLTKRYPNCAFLQGPPTQYGRLRT